MTENETQPRRGRPRPLVTLERDEKVFEVLSVADAAMTRKEVAEKLGWEGNVVYACLNRLRRTDRVKKVNGNTYQLLR